MSELERYLVSVDPAQGVVKVEKIGEAGDLTAVDPAALTQTLGISGAGSCSGPRTVINIFTGGPSDGPASLTVSSELPHRVMGFDKPPSPPRGDKPGKPRKR